MSLCLLTTFCDLTSDSCCIAFWTLVTLGCIVVKMRLNSLKYYSVSPAGVRKLEVLGKTGSWIFRSWDCFSRCYNCSDASIDSVLWFHRLASSKCCQYYTYKLYHKSQVFVTSHFNNIVQRNHSCTDPIRELIVFHRSSWVRKGGGGRKGREKEEQLREEKRWDGIVGGRRKGRGGDSKGGKEREG